MKRTIVSILLLVCLVVPSYAYTDVASNAWYHDAVTNATLLGFVAGVGNDRFDPDGLVTYEQVAQVLYRIFRQQDAATGPYWYSAAVNWCKVKMNIGHVMERQEVVKVLYGQFYQGSCSTDHMSKFSDTSEIRDDCLYACAWATKSGVLSGSDGKLMPASTITRAQLAQLMCNFYVHYRSGILPVLYGYTNPDYINSKSDCGASLMIPTKGQAVKPNANGFFTNANVDIQGATLRPDMMAAINMYLKSLGLKEAHWVTMDEQAEYTLCRAKEAHTQYSHDRPNAAGGPMPNTAECLMQAETCLLNHCLTAWQNSPGHDAVIRELAPGNSICVAEYEGTWVLVIFMDNNASKYSINNYFK